MARTGYAKLSNSFYLSTKVKKLRRQQPTAVIVYVMAISYCSDNLTDGRLSGDDLLYQLDATDEDINELCTVDLLEPDGNGGYLIHDYLDYQSSKNQVEEQTEKARDRKRKWRESQHSHTNVTTGHKRDKDVSHTCVTPTETYNQEPRTKNQITIPPTPSRGGTAEEIQFDRFLKAYPKFANRAASLKAWNEVVTPGLVDADTLIASAKEFARQWKQSGKEARYAPAPKDFITGGWEKYKPTQHAAPLSEAFISNLLGRLPPDAGFTARRDIIRLHQHGTPLPDIENQITSHYAPQEA
ncbi:MAG: hypothetical protein LKJ05_02720 [Bifidobacteriaceae bacterium]|jgi:hypothetical protein|nr:hypothetical protein [Bifidobacteriaceae bacterium]